MVWSFHLEPDILECEIKWALEYICRNNTSEGNGIPAQLFQILNDDAVSVALNMPPNLEKSAMATRLEKPSFCSNTKERQSQRMFKLPHNWAISHAIKVMVKFLQASLQQYAMENFGMYKSDEKAEELEIKLPTFVGS